MHQKIPKANIIFSRYLVSHLQIQCFKNESKFDARQAGTLLIADQCNLRNIHCTVYGTGCIYEYDESHIIGGNGFLEDEPPNFDKSFYSMTKVISPSRSLIFA